ncbi:MAG: hypothetical protein IJJ81_07130, partial [Ruminococcus sp.]|nr:hypothetical protein [Ruminococcus sp.]
ENKTVNAVDASYVLEEYANNYIKKPSGFSSAQKTAADVNKDKNIDAIDASYILSYYAYNSITSNPKKTFEEYLKTA